MEDEGIAAWLSLLRNAATFIVYLRSIEGVWWRTSFVTRNSHSTVLSLQHLLKLLIDGLSTSLLSYCWAWWHMHLSSLCPVRVTCIPHPGKRSLSLLAALRISAPTSYRQFRRVGRPYHLTTSQAPADEGTSLPLHSRWSEVRILSLSSLYFPTILGLEVIRTPSSGSKWLSWRPRSMYG